MPQAQANTPSDIEESIARTIIGECLESRSPDALQGVVVAHIREKSPVRVWRYDEGKLVEVSTEAYEDALGSVRSEWPPNTYLFSLESVSSNHAVVDVHTLYNMGITEQSRGGHADKWELKRESAGWVVVDQETYLFWD